VDVNGAELDLSPLLQLPRLCRIHVTGSPQASQCGVLQRMSDLTSLVVSMCSSAALSALLRSPHSLQRLEELEITDTVIDPSMMAALSKLPALTALWPKSIRPECWAGLAGLPQLRSLKLTWERSFNSAQRSALTAALANLPHLTDLSIKLAEDHSFDGPPLALALPALRVLCLRWLRVPSLSFLQRSPLLESLNLVQCTEMSAADVMASLRAHPLPGIRHLHLSSSVTLSAEEEAALRPPSSLLPSLIDWSYFSSGHWAMQ